jgi:hypothetical protein
MVFFYGDAKQIHEPRRNSTNTDICPGKHPITRLHRRFHLTIRTPTSLAIGLTKG